MTTDTEALRRAFEAFSLDGGLTPGDLEWNGRFYIVPFTQDEWLTFQAGHAAAKAETAAAVAAERERCLRIVESVDNYSNPMTANDCAGAIRAGATERGE